MKKSFPLLSSVLLTCSLIPISSASASDASNPADGSITPKYDEQLDLERNLPALPKNLIDFSNLQIIESEGTVLTFDSAADMSSYLNASQSGEIETQAVGERLIGTETKYMQFVGYAKSSSAWAMVPSYTIDKGSNLGISGKISSKWGEVGVSSTKSYNVSMTIKADPKRWSKLAGYADIKVERYKVSRPNVSISYYVTKTKVLEKYIKVKYK